MATSLISTGVQFPDNSVQGVSSNFIQQTFTSPATWTKPTGIKAVRVTVVGGGGGGGGSRNSTSTGRGGAGGAGGTAVRYIAASDIPGPVSVTIGGGGAGGPAPGSDTTATAGSAGGTSSYGPFASSTGGAGALANPGAASGFPGPGGIGSGPGRNIQGPSVAAIVSPGTPTGTTHGCPADNGRPDAGVLNFSPASGINAGATTRPLGSGGAGGYAFGAAGAGGAGAGGVVVVEEFY